jgi:hypothetical protein
MTFGGVSSRYARGVNCPLTGSPKWKFLPSQAPGGFSLVLVFIAVAAAIPRLILGASQYVEYDGYWHVFIAQQDNWRRFWSDIYTNAHPPLYFLLLKVVLHLGHSLLIYRSISMLTGVATVFFAGWIARKLMGSNIRACQTALGYGLALPAIIVSCEVRSYMLSVFFILVSFWYLLDIPGSGGARREGRARAGFAAGAVLACLSHYFAFFYSGAAIVLLLGRFVVRWYRRAITNWRTEAFAEAATSVPVAAIIYTLYKVHAGRWAQIQNHLLPYYYDRHGHETIAAFLLRNWKNFVNLFSPFQISSNAVAIGMLVLAIAGTLLMAVFLRGDFAVPEKKEMVARKFWTILITVMMLAGIALTAIAGKYPFGGDLRQQFLLFPFLILCIAMFIDQVANRMPAFTPVRTGFVLNWLAVAAIVVISAVRFEQYPKVEGNISSQPVAVFNNLERAPTAVYLDQFNLITFFIYHDDWDWSAFKPPRAIPGIDVYQLHRGPERMLVFRDKTHWNVDPDDPAVYIKLAECLRLAGIREVSVFSPRQTPPKPPLSDLNVVRSEMVSLASSSGVCVQRMAVNRIGWYATLKQSNCPTQDIPRTQITGTFDDVNNEIKYTGVWAHSSFPAAANKTVSYSNDTGAVARLSFAGTEITYIYTKAFNRGVAAVKVDGISRGDIDLYSPKVVWQARKLFGGLTAGKHTFELIVAGRKQAAATDQFVDVDALIVR